MSIHSYDEYKTEKSFLISMIAWVFSIKLLIFFIDPTVMFFIDDSSRYLDTAISSYIPPDRSFLYGFLIRWLTYPYPSLSILVFFQALCSAASAVILGFIMYEFFSVKRTISLASAILCSLAPVQLLYERYVLTETVSLLFFALYIWAAFYYLRDRKIKQLAALSLAGVFLIAFRLSYLPIVLIGAVITPGLAYFNLADKHVRENTGGSTKGIRKRIVANATHIIISCLLTFSLHSAYKIINGKLSDQPPAYQYRDGYHLLASWAPLLKSEDLADPKIAGYTQQWFYHRLEDRFERMNQRWSNYGLIYYIHHMYNSSLKTNKIARDTARNILHRDPFGIVKLTWQSYLDYWDLELLKKNLLQDRSVREFPNDLLKILKSEYKISGEGLLFQKTFTNQYFLNAIPWYLVLFSLPLIILISFLMDKGHLPFLILLGLFSLLILMNSTALIHRNTMRFFHPNEWMAVIFLGVLFDRIKKNRKRYV